MGLCASKNHPVNPNEGGATAGGTAHRPEHRRLPPRGSSFAGKGSLLNVDESSLRGSALMDHRYRVARSHKHFQTKGRPESPSSDSDSGMLDDEQRTLVASIVERSPVFTNVNEAMLEGLLKEFVPIAARAGDTVFAEGDDSDLFYIVAAGALQARKGDAKPREIAAGTTVGEDALRLKSKRTATATAVEDATLLALSRVVYQRLVVKLGATELNRGVSRLRSVPILAPLTDEQLATVADTLREVRFERGHYIIRQGDQGDAFYIIKHGEVSCRFDNSQEEVRRLKAGDFFGEGALLTNSPRSMNVIAASRAITCLRMSREDFASTLGSLHELLDHNFNKRVLSSVPLFNKLSDQEQDEIAEHMVTKTYGDAEFIIQQGEEASAFYIVKEGHVKVTRTGEDGVETEVGVMVAGDFFGEGGFLTGEPTTANCIAVGAVSCAALQREEFIEILGSIEDVLAQNFSERVKHWEPGESMEMRDLVAIRRLGAGNFGRVDIVRHKVSGKTFALKQMLLRKVEAMDLQVYVENERAILADLQCPFIVRLHGTFRTRRSLYLLMDYILGGELSRVLEETPALPPAAARFYSANLVLALKYMHGKWIVHRDLKPQNIMIEKNGYLKLVDFGLAKRLKAGGRTFTICGTPDYVAPEVLRIGSSTGYGLAADWWAFGILMFKFTTGYHPFGLTCSSDLSEVWSILCEYANRYPTFEFGLPTKDLTDIVKRLLHPNPAKRLGGQKSGARKVMKHPFFASVDWSAMARQTLKPPFMPHAKDMLDTTNFEEDASEQLDALSTVAEDDPGDAWYKNF